MARLDIVEWITRQVAGLSREDLMRMIKKKMEDLGGLIEEEAAALLVAKELGLSPPKTYMVSTHSSLKIRDLIPGLRGVSIRARVVAVRPPMELDTGKRMLKLVLGDETGVTNLTIWDGERMEEYYRRLVPGMCIQVRKASVRRYRDRLELVLDEGGEIEVTDDCGSLPDLEQLCASAGIKYVKFTVCEKVKGAGFVFYGLAGEEPVQLVAPADKIDDAVAGDVILAQDVRMLTGLTPRYISGRLTRLYKLERREAVQNPFRDLDVDEARGDAGRFMVGLAGFFVAVQPFRTGEGGTITLAGKNASVRIFTFSDSFLATLSWVPPATKILIRGVYVDSGYRIKTHPYASFGSIGSLEPGEPGETLAVRGGYVNCPATIVECSIKYRASKEALILAATLGVDDGVGHASLTVSYPPMLSGLLGLTVEEIKEYGAILPKLASYMEEELLGKDVLVSGFITGDGVIVPFKVQPSRT